MKHRFLFFVFCFFVFVIVAFIWFQNIKYTFKI